MVKTTATICFCSKEALADSSETAHSWSGRKELAEGSGRYAINGLSERKSLRGRFTVKTWHLSGAIVLVGVFLSTTRLPCYLRFDWPGDGYQPAATGTSVVSAIPALRSLR